ncbi:MAG: hypothetical protein HC917_27450 [Richelia sp. SM2_1_7]|nr:hypothetical protein [Richelia sp. SM2_1_7]
MQLCNQLATNDLTINLGGEKLVSLIIEKAYRLMKNALKEEDSHTLQSVLTLFNDINIFAPNQLSILEWNKVCWFGSLLAGMQDKTKHLENLSSACEKSLQTNKTQIIINFLDTKAVFMALKGDFTQAENTLKKYTAQAHQERFITTKIEKKNTKSD